MFFPQARRTGLRKKIWTEFAELLCQPAREHRSRTIYRAVVFLPMAMVVVSYTVIVLLALACLPGLAFAITESPPAQLGLLFLGGLVVAARHFG
jgi:ABC-type sugar transport system permease subunit